MATALPTTIVTAVTLLFASGCTYFAPKRARLDARLAEESRALTTAVVETLDAQPQTNRDTYTQLALTFAKQDQRIQGMPEKPFNVAPLIADLLTTETQSAQSGTNTNPHANGSTKNVPSSSVSSVPLWLNLPSAQPNASGSPARQELASRFAAENKLLIARNRVEEKLLTLGAKAEEQRNERITRWTKFSLVSVTLIGGLIALFIFCPIAIPIAGRLLAWLVSKIPSLSSAVGVVSVKAFDAIVRGIENAKQNTPSYVVPPSGGSPANPTQEPPNGGTTYPDTSMAAPTVPVANTATATATFPLSPSVGESGPVGYCRSDNSRISGTYFDEPQAEKILPDTREDVGRPN